MSKKKIVDKPKTIKGFQWKLMISVLIAGAVGIALGSIAWWLYTSTKESHSHSEKIHSKISKPNIIIFLADDTGYGDFHSYGHPTQERTGIDRMAEEGMRFTQFYTPAPICSPSRAAILTGRYPVRTGVFGQHRVFAHLSPGGLPRREVTIAEVAKQAGYVTGMAGKWHLGINKDNSTDGYHLPRHHGFEEVKTILPFSQNWFCKQFTPYNAQLSRNCFLYNDDNIIEQPINLGKLSSNLLHDAKDFINTHKEKRFLYLLSFPQTHDALFSDARFAGKSKRGPYGDSVMEMGWVVDEVLKHLVKLDIDSDTFALFLSDHGAVRAGCHSDGSNGPLRGGKSQSWEGGVRIPAIAWWPGVIQPGSVSNAILSTLDILPTVQKLIEWEEYKPKQPLIDGQSFDGIIKGDGKISPNATLFFYCADTLTAVRYGKHKVHYYISMFPNEDFVPEGGPICTMTNEKVLHQLIERKFCDNDLIKQDPPLIFNLETDPEEHISLSQNSRIYQDVMNAVSNAVENHKATIVPVESEIDRNIKPILQPCCDPPLCMCNFEE